MTLPSRTVASAFLAGSLAMGAGAAAAGPGEDRRMEGSALATQLCSQCHLVGREPQIGDFAGPAFLRVANMPSTTGLSLNVFLQSHHRQMPSLRLDRDEMNAVIDYILSLKDTRAP